MFTGIIEEVGAVTRRSGAELDIMAKVVLEDVSIGDSIAVNGVCLTVVEFSEERFVVQVSPETYKRTTLDRIQPGDAVNLERAMAAGDRFGGHFVLGHVDAVGLVDSVQDQGEFSFWKFKAPGEVAKYLVPKGSVTIDGISLTVVEPRDGSFGVAVIPETLKKTTLQGRRPGDPVNLEADVIGKHIMHYMQNAGGGITKEMLTKYGFA